ncbi:hypothetical protein SJAV_09250 [Sulfurisphaera javensis]|uniref:Uncharacterized protein n=1 Tax=Sulfurisphaera javensis TaxID=2049879 RepID=A0AAT9GQR7_9CREN
MSQFYVRETISEKKPKLHFYSQTGSSYVKVFSARLGLSDLKLFLEKVNFPHKVTKKSVYTDDETLFKMMVVYVGSLQNVRKKVLYTVLVNVVSSFDNFTLHFWYSEFTSRYMKTNSMVSTYRVGRALRDLYVKGY